MFHLPACKLDRVLTSLPRRIVIGIAVHSTLSITPRTQSTVCPDMTKLWYSDSEMVTINSDTTCIAVWKWATPQDVLVENHARMQAISCRTALFLKKQGTGCGTVSSLCGGSYTAHGKTWRWLQPTLGKPSMKSDRENEEEERRRHSSLTHSLHISFVIFQEEKEICRFYSYKHSILVLLSQLDVIIFGRHLPQLLLSTLKKSGLIAHL